MSRSFNIDAPLDGYTLHSPRAVVECEMWNVVCSSVCVGEGCTNAVLDIGLRRSGGCCVTRDYSAE